MDGRKWLLLLPVNTFLYVLERRKAWRFSILLSSNQWTDVVEHIAGAHSITATYILIHFRDTFGMLKCTQIEVHDAPVILHRAIAIQRCLPVWILILHYLEVRFLLVLHASPLSRNLVVISGMHLRQSSLVVTHAQRCFSLLRSVPLTGPSAHAKALLLQRDLWVSQDDTSRLGRRG